MSPLEKSLMLGLAVAISLFVILSIVAVLSS